MIDFENLSNYKENNRLEAKNAKGGLPKSIWETYSAFANTSGGVILLGVEEKADKTLNIAGLENPEKLLVDFWDTIHNPNKVNLNILSDKNAQIVNHERGRVIVIEVPRADRTVCPIFLNEKPYSETYRRDGEGDYHCSAEEIEAMFRDKSIKTQDMLVLDKMDFSVFDYETINRYRNQMKFTRSEHVWRNLEDNDFLYRLGAVAYGEDKKLHPTAAGLLMFGFEYEIVKEYPYYFLDYQEQFDLSRRWDDRIISSSGEWSGNVYDFYRKAYNKLAQNIKVPFLVENGLRVEDTPTHKALREALANCLINADYYGRRGLVIKLKPDEITFENPGRFRIEIAVAMDGIVSDPRNSVLMKMFNLLDVGERSGRGIFEIYAVWKSMNRPSPTIGDMQGVDRTILTLPLEQIYSENIVKNDFTIKSILTEREHKILLELKEKKDITTLELAKRLNVSDRTVKSDLKKLELQKIIKRVGSRKTGFWKIQNENENF